MLRYVSLSPTGYDEEWVPEPFGISKPVSAFNRKLGVCALASYFTQTSRYLYVKKTNKLQTFSH